MLNRTIHMIRILCIILAVLSLVLFTVVYVDYSSKSVIRGPQVTMDTDTITISIKDGSDAVLQGIQAVDAQGNDVSSLMIVESYGRFASDGSRMVRIAAFDRQGNVSKISRTIYYSDYVPPRVSLRGPLCAVSNSKRNLLEQIQVFDSLEGDISSDVTLSYIGGTSIPTEGEFQVLLQVSNSAGDSLEMPLTVEYYNAAQERTRPKIGLTDYLIYVRSGQKVQPEDYLDNLTLDGRHYYFDAENQAFVQEGNTYQQAINSIESGLILPLSQLQIAAPGVYRDPGVYEITYRCASAAGVIGTVRLVIVVENSGG